MGRMDVIIGCLDNRIARLFINRYAYKAGKIWIDGAIENLSGQLNVFKNGELIGSQQIDQLEGDRTISGAYIGQSHWQNNTDTIGRVSDVQVGAL